MPYFTDYSHSCASTFTMIRKNSLFIKLLKLNISSFSLFNSFMDKFNPALETCPVCGCCGNLHVHSYYYRYLIDFINNNPVTHQIKIMRVSCDSCSTHAILPDFIIPYSSYSLFFILRVLSEYFLKSHTVEKLCERFGIDTSQLYTWLNLFKAHKSQWLGALEDAETSPKSFLNTVSESYSPFAMVFTRSFSYSFLQSHANPPTAHYCQQIFSPDYDFMPTT